MAVYQQKWDTLASMIQKEQQECLELVSHKSYQFDYKRKVYDATNQSDLDDILTVYNVIANMFKKVLNPFA